MILSFTPLTLAATCMLPYAPTMTCTLRAQYRCDVTDSTCLITTIIKMQKDDSFQLYDLRVEVVCPPGERILCGAKEGDHFLLQGELLHLPAGQGFSIYSLGELRDAVTVYTNLTGLVSLIKVRFFLF